MFYDRAHAQCIQVIHFKMPTFVGILKFMTRTIMTLSVVLNKNIAAFVIILILKKITNFMPSELCMEKD